MSKILNTVSPNAAKTGSPTFPCADAHTVSFQLGGVKFPVDPRDFGRQAFAGDTHWCVPNLAPTDAPVLGDYLYSWSLGQPFLRG